LTVKNNLQKLQAVKEVTKSEKKKKEKKRHGITLGFWWSNNLQPPTLRV